MDEQVGKVEVHLGDDQGLVRATHAGQLAQFLADVLGFLNIKTVRGPLKARKLYYCSSVIITES